MKVIVSKLDRSLYNGEAEELLVPGVDGDMTILPNHSALVTTLRKGAVTVRAGDSEESWNIEKGVLEVSNDTATVLI